MYETKHKIRQIIKLINNILFFFKIIESNEFRIKEDVNNIIENNIVEFKNVYKREESQYALVK